MPKEKQSSNINPQHKQITEKQAWECTARWLNSMYIAYSRDEKVDIPCARCPYFVDTCRVANLDATPLKEMLCPQDFFKIIERFTGEGTIVSPFLEQSLLSGTVLY